MPGEADGDLGVEVEAPGETGGLHDIQQRPRRVETHAEKRIPDAPAEGFEVGPEIGDFPPLDAQCGGGGVEDGAAEHRRFGVRGGEFQKPVHDIRGVLAVGIHRQHVGESGGDRFTQTMEHRGAFAGIHRQLDDPEIGVFRVFQPADEIDRVIRGAVDDDPDRHLEC